MNEEIKAKMVEDIMENFDFERVHKAMVTLDWLWFIDNEYRIPTLEEIKTHAGKMMLDALNGMPYATGGFYCTYKNGILELSFELASWFSHNGITE